MSVAVIDVDAVKSTDGEAKMETDSSGTKPAASAEGGDVFKVMDSVGEVDSVIPVVDSGKYRSSNYLCLEYMKRTILYK